MDPARLQTIIEPLETLLLNKGFAKQEKKQENSDNNRTKDKIITTYFVREDGKTVECNLKVDKAKLNGDDLADWRGYCLKVSLYDTDVHINSSQYTITGPDSSTAKKVNEYIRKIVNPTIEQRL